LPEKELNEMEASKLPDTEFKTMVIKMLKEHSENDKELSENFNRIKEDMETDLKKKSEMVPF